MKRSFVRTLVVVSLAAALIAVLPLASATAAPGQWVKPNATAPDWAAPESGLHPTTLTALAFNGPMTSLTNTGRLATEEMAWYGMWLFPGQTLNLRLATSSDFLLVLLDKDDEELAFADGVDSGTEVINFNYADFSTGPQFVWIGVGAFDGGTYTLRVSMTDPPVDPALARVSGADRYATAVKASQDAFAGGADTVIIATGANFPDALAAAGLCGAYDAPLLLVPAASLPSAVSSEIDRLGATKAIIIGGTTVVSSAVQNALAAKPALSGKVSRIAGTDRYMTARKVAEAMQTELGVPLTDAIVVCGTSFPDALSASPLAYAGNRPILLTPTKYAHSSLLGAMDSVGVENVTIVGGTPVVSAAAEQQIETALGAQTQRWSGANRYETSRIVAENSVATGAVSRGFIGYASGLGFPDGLSGGVASGRMGGALLLTQPHVEPSPMQQYNVASTGVTTGARLYGAGVVVWGNVLGMIADDLGF